MYTCMCMLCMHVWFADGELVDARGATLAYIESDGEVGDATMAYLGRAHAQSGMVVNEADELIGELDVGRGYVRDPLGSVIAELSRAGKARSWPNPHAHCTQ